MAFLQRFSWLQTMRRPSHAKREWVPIFDWRADRRARSSPLCADAHPAENISLVANVPDVRKYRRGITRILEGQRGGIGAVIPSRDHHRPTSIDQFAKQRAWQGCLGGRLRSRTSRLPPLFFQANGFTDRRQERRPWSEGGCLEDDERWSGRAVGRARLAL